MLSFSIRLLRWFQMILEWFQRILMITKMFSYSQPCMLAQIASQWRYFLTLGLTGFGFHLLIVKTVQLGISLLTKVRVHRIKIDQDIYTWTTDQEAVTVNWVKIQSASTTKTLITAFQTSISLISWVREASVCSDLRVWLVSVLPTMKRMQIYSWRRWRREAQSMKLYSLCP